MLIIKEKIKKVSNGPGIYQFLDKKGIVLYIGRAVNLKSRISSYFNKNIDLRIKEMISLAKNIKIKKTNNLLEAVILEANLIKKHWPKYNVKERDNRSFVYLVIGWCK